MKILDLLKIQPLARERANKNYAIGYVIKRNHNLDIPSKTFQEIVGEILSMDREWRKILEDSPDLRGADYDDKDRLAQEKQVELGYEAGQTVREFKKL